MWLFMNVVIYYINGWKVKTFGRSKNAIDPVTGNLVCFFHRS